MKRHTLHHSIFAATMLFSSTLLAGESDKKTITPTGPMDDGWKFSLSLPGWIPWLTGDTGLNGHIANVDLAPDNIIPRLDMIADVRAEANKGRFSVLGELLYMSLSDGVGTNTVVKKLDFQVDQTLADLAFAWRLIEGPRGYLAVTGGVRYVNLYQKVALQPNDGRIDEVADTLSKAGTLARLKIARELVALAGDRPTVPIAPIAGDRIDRIARTIERIKGNTAERKAQITKVLTNALDTTVSRTDDWWDPYIGFRGRYNLTDKFYLTAKGDIGGFGVGADLDWTAEAALGVQLSQHVFTEVGYRAWGLDYEKDGLTMDVITQGVQVTLGVNF